MERKPIKSVSVERNSHNRDIDENLLFSIPPIKGCYTFDGKYRVCDECPAGICPDFFVCALDVPDSDWHSLYFDPRDQWASFKSVLDHE